MGQQQQQQQQQPQQQHPQHQHQHQNRHHQQPHLHIHRIKPATRAREYQNLRHVVPSLRRQRDVDKVEVVTEAARYIDHLHKTLIERFVLCGIPDSLRDVLGTDDANELGSQHIMNLVASMATAQRRQQQQQPQETREGQSQPTDLLRLPQQQQQQQQPRQAMEKSHQQRRTAQLSMIVAPISARCIRKVGVAGRTNFAKTKLAHPSPTYAHRVRRRSQQQQPSRQLLLLRQRRQQQQQQQQRGLAAKALAAQSHARLQARRHPGQQQQQRLQHNLHHLLPRVARPLAGSKGPLAPPIRRRDSSDL